VLADSPNLWLFSESASAELERTWAESLPFGDWRYIRDRLLEASACRIQLVQRAFPDAIPVASQLAGVDGQIESQVLQHPFLRALLLLATVHLKQPWNFIPRNDVNELFRQLGDLLRGGWRGGELPSASLLLTLAEEDQRVAEHAIWRCAGSEQMNFANITSYLFLKSNPSYSIRHFQDDELQCLRQGIQLLKRVFPVLSPSVLRHIDMIALGSAHAPSFISYTCDTCPGAIFLNPYTLRNAWFAAEVILHEGLHLKLYDVMHTHNLLRQGYSHDESARVHPLWHSRIESWNAHRALFTMHVYAHLAFFFLRAHGRFKELTATFGPPHISDPRVAFTRATQRARFLGKWLANEGWIDLGQAGRQLVSDLEDMLRALDGDADYDKISRGLIGDLYERQTLAVEAFLARCDKQPEVLQSPHVARLASELSSLNSDLLDGSLLPPTNEDNTRSSLAAYLRSIVALRKDILSRFETHPFISLDAMTDATNRSGIVLQQANLAVDLNP
jgi:hypothetical protein